MKDTQKSEANIVRPEAEVIKGGKVLPLIIDWGDKRIYIGELQFLGNGSLVFESAFHSDKNVGQNTEFGTSTFKEGKFRDHTSDTKVDVNTGFHVSLHPPADDKSGVMHFREHYPGKVLFQRTIDWFPVTVPFNLLRVFTLPLDMCVSSQKQTAPIARVDPNYKDSLEVIIDIFPKEAQEHYPYPASIETWGTCPDYLVRVSVVLAKQRTAALVYWPVDNELKL